MPRARRIRTRVDLGAGPRDVQVRIGPHGCWVRVIGSGTKGQFFLPATEAVALLARAAQRRFCDMALGTLKRLEDDRVLRVPMRVQEQNDDREGVWGRGGEPVLPLSDASRTPPE